MLMMERHGTSAKGYGKATGSRRSVPWAIVGRILSPLPVCLPGMNPRSGQVVSRDGTIIAYDEVGSRTARHPDCRRVVLSSAGAWRENWPRCWPGSSRCSPTTVEGRGDSGENAPYGVTREVEDLEALMKEAGGSAFVFGHSSGAVLALRAAAQAAIKSSRFTKRRSSSSRMPTFAQNDWAQTSRPPSGPVRRPKMAEDEGRTAGLLHQRPPDLRPRA